MAPKKGVGKNRRDEMGCCEIDRRCLENQCCNTGEWGKLLLPVVTCVEDARTYITQSDQKLTRSHTACYAPPAASALYVLIINWLMALIGIIIIAVAGECVWCVTLCVSVHHVWHVLVWLVLIRQHPAIRHQPLGLNSAPPLAWPQRACSFSQPHSSFSSCEYLSHSLLRTVRCA